MGGPWWGERGLVEGVHWERAEPHVRSKDDVETSLFPLQLIQHVSLESQQGRVKELPPSHEDS